MEDGKFFSKCVLQLFNHFAFVFKYFYKNLIVPAKDLENIASCFAWHFDPDSIALWISSNGNRTKLAGLSNYQQAFKRIANKNFHQTC